TRESDFVTQITPGIRINGSGPRLRASFDYRPTALFYAQNSEQNRVLQNLFGNGTLEALERFFFVDATGSIAQGYITPLGARPEYESKLFRGRLFLQPTPELRLNANAGRERNNYILQQEKSYYIRGVGALWKPGPRTSAEAQYEQRFFGPYRLARFDHRTRL